MATAKTTKKEKFNEYTKEQLITALKDTEKKFQEYRFSKVVGDARDTSNMKKARLDIAKIKTYLRQYELGLKK